MLRYSQLVLHVTDLLVEVAGGAMGMRKASAAMPMKASATMAEVVADEVSMAWADQCR